MAWPSRRAGEAAATEMIISTLAKADPLVRRGGEHFPQNEYLQELGLPTRQSLAWVALNCMLNTPYFSRVWIMQELALAPTYDLLWGDAIIPKVTFESFKWAATFL